MTKRILQVIPTLDRAGAEKQMVLLAQGLPRDEFEVHVCVLTRDGPLHADLERANIPVTVIGKPWKLDPRAYWRLRAYIRRLRPDLVHTWLFAANAYGRAAALACGVKCLVAAERCVDPWKSAWQLAIDRRLARRTSRIVANSAGVRDFYVQRGLPAEKFLVIANGVEPPPSSPITRAELLAELGLPEGVYLVGLIGRLWPQKRVKDAIWAADLLRVIHHDFHVLILGDGPQASRLKKFRDQCQVHNLVHFLGHRADVARLLPHFDMLWSTSGYEGQSNAILEAMAAGVPVVATDIPGTRDLVVHGETGFLVSPGNRSASAPTVNKAVAAGVIRFAHRLLNDAELARRLGEASRKRALDQFSVARMVAGYAALYRELLE